MRTLSRRSAIRGLAAGAAAITAQLQGLVPEIALVPGIAGSVAGSRPKAKVRGRELFGAELAAAVERVHRDNANAPLRAHLARTGFRQDPGRTMAVAMETTSGEPIAFTVVTDFRDLEGRRSARLVYQAGPASIRAGLAEWADDRPDELVVSGMRNGAAQKLGTISIGTDEIVVDDIATGRKAYPSRMERGSKGPGYAAMAGPGTRALTADFCQETCSWVAFTYCGTVCEYSFFVVCSVILALTGLPGLACFLISLATCVTTCTVTQQYVCSSVSC